MRAYELQAIGRVRRFPQKRLVRVYRMLAQGSVEEGLYGGMYGGQSGHQSHHDAAISDSRGASGPIHGVTASAPQEVENAVRDALSQEQQNSPTTGTGTVPAPASALEPVETLDGAGRTGRDTGCMLQ